MKILISLSRTWGAFALVAVVSAILSSPACNSSSAVGCGEACAKLAECEDEWLVYENGKGMTEEEEDRYMSDCLDDCTGADDHTACIAKASCDDLLDGDCR